MRNKKQVANEILGIIKKDLKTAFTFFAELKEINIFLDLAEVGAFDRSLLPSIEKKDNGYIHHMWPQAIYLEFIANHIQKEKLDGSSQIVQKYLEILTGLTVDTENTTVVNSIFKCFSLLPAKVISCEEIQRFFRYISYEGSRNVVLEYIVHDGFDRVMETVLDNCHDINIFKCYLKELFGARSKKLSYGTDENLLFFNEHRMQEFRKTHFNLEKLYNERKYLIKGAVSVFNELLLEVLANEDIDESTQHWRPAVEDHGQNRYHDSAQSIYTGFLFKTLNFLSLEGEHQEDIERLSKSEYISLNRIYIALVTENPDLYNINNCAKKLLSYGLSSSLKYEGYNFLKNHFVGLDGNIQNRILNAIEALKDDYAKNNDERTLFSSWKKIRWLQSIKDSGNARALQMYQKCFEITGAEAEHPEFSSYMSGGWVGSRSPWSKEDFANFEPDEILDKLKNFKNTDDFRGPTKEGLSRTLEDFILDDPAKSSALVKNLDQLEPIYISAIYGGYAKVWKENKLVPVKGLLDKFNEILNDEDFCKDFKVKNSKSLWTVNAVLRFIQAGVRDDEKAFDKSFNKVCYEIINKLTEKVLPSDEYTSSADAYTRAINEPRGVLFETAILWALREARLANNNQKDIDKSWNSLHELIKKPLESKDVSEVSLHALIGAYYRQISYLNNSWLFDNLELIAPQEETLESLWIAFMEGFCYVTVFVKDVYEKLYDHGLLLKFLRLDSEEEDKNSRLDRLQGRVVELSLIAYILGVEELASGVMGEIIKNQNCVEWKKLINSIVPIAKKESKSEYQQRVKLLMSKLFQEYEDSGDKEKWTDHFSGVTRLLDLIDDVGDKNVLSIIKISVSYSEGFYGLADIVEYLCKFVEEKPKFVGDLFVETLSNTSEVPTYPEDKVKKIFEAVKKAGEGVLLAKMCRIYTDKHPEYRGLDGIC